MNRKIIAVIIISAVLSTTGYFIKDISAFNMGCNINSVFHTMQLREVLQCQANDYNRQMTGIQMDNEDIREHLELLDVNQKIIANATDIEIYRSIEEYRNSTRTEVTAK